MSQLSPNDNNNDKLDDNESIAQKRVLDLLYYT